MDRLWRYFFILCWLVYLLLASVSVFLSGFLLNRDVLTNQSICNEQHQHSGFKNIGQQQICIESRSRVVLMIIDALMYDFTLYDGSRSEVLPYENKMPVFSELLQKKPSQTQLYKFIADPPTTTMQRLKGLTTGSLPTFIDAGSNFASSEIDEDNFLNQLQSHDRNIVFMGDDTWNSLYPNKFLREYPYPSFNVWDLDTVDRGVERHLFPQLKEKDWDLLIAHFLGVDHCGHRYGPNHPEMNRKLSEMDTVIRQTVDQLDNETMLIVIGDHGMTSTGNHGGDSIAEVTAAMFVYSPYPLMTSTLDLHQEAVNQVDLVPTLATILGSPIPFSSLGSLIVEALPADSDDWHSTFTAMLNNVNQVYSYIDTYSQSTHQFSEDDLANLKREYNNLVRLSQTVKTLGDFKIYLTNSRTFLSSVKYMCEQVWVQFDIPLMCFGLFVNILFIIASFIIIQNVPSQILFALLDSKTLYVTSIIIFICSFFGWVLSKLFLEISCVLTLLVCVIFIYSNFNDIRNGIRAQRKHCDWLNIVTLLLILGNLLGMFSNSYIVEESTVVSFWCVTLVFAIIFTWKIDTSKSGKSRYVRPWLPINHEKLIVILLISLFCVTLRILPSYWQCREEQTWCQNTYTPNETVKSSNMLKEVSFLPICLICLPVFIVWMWLRKCGNLVSLSLSMTFMKLVPILITILIFVYWILESLPKKLLMKMVPWNIQILPQIIYLLLTIGVLCLLIYPLCVHVVPPKKKSIHFEGDKNILPHIFQHIKSALNEDKSQKNADNIPAVFGLPTVFSATFIIVDLLLLQLLSLLQGSKFAPALVVMFFASSLLLGVLGVSRISSAVLAPQLLYVPWHAVCVWGLLSMTSFYGTGHQATMPGIQWQAAFVGTDGEFSSNFLPGLMVTVSTFSAQAWFGFTLPLLMICPMTLLAMFQLSSRQDIKRSAVNGEVFIFEHSILASHSVFTLCAKYILFYALRVCASMTAAFLHRRHLMVWKIFAPKLIFEAAGLGVSVGAVLLGFLVFSLISRRLEALMQQLQDGQNS